MTAAGKKIIEPGKWYAEFDEDGNVTKAVYEESYRRLLGYGTEAEYANNQESWVDGVHPDDLPRVDEYFAEFVKKHPEGMDYDIEYRMRTKTGYRWFHDYAVCTRRADGSPLRCNGVAFDIQATMYEEAQLESAPETIRWVMNMMQAIAGEYDPIIVIEPYSGKYDWYIRKASDVAGDTSMTIHGENLYDNIAIDSASIIHEDDREQFRAFYSRENLLKIAETGISRTTENRWFIKGEKRYRWKYNKVVRMIDGNGKVYVVAGVIDTTEAREEAARKEEQEKSNELVTVFANEYEASFLCSLSTDEYRILSEKGRVVKGKAQQTFFGDALPTYVASFVHPDDKELFSRGLFSASDVKNRLSIGETVSFEYRSHTHGKYSWRRAVINRMSEDTVLIGLKDCDAEVTSRIINDKLLDRYDALYTVDLNNDEIWPVRGSRVVAGGAFKEKKKFSGIARGFAGIVAPKYRQDWLNFSDAGYMKEYLADTDQREYIYELPGTEKTMRRLTIDVLERIDGEAAEILLSFVGIDDIQAEAMRLQEKMAEQSAQLAETLEKANLEAQRNDLLYDVMNAGKWSYEFNAADEVIAAHYSEGVYEKTHARPVGDPMKWLDFVHPEDKERVLKEFMAAIRDHSGLTKYDAVFRIIGNDGKVRWCKSAGRIVRRSDGSGELFGMNQDMTAQIEEIARSEKTEIELQHEQFKREALNAFVVDSEADPVELLKNYAERLRVLVNCDQVIYRGFGENRILVNNPAFDEAWTVPIEYCRQCPHSDIHNPLYKEGYTEMNNCQLEGWRGIPVYEKCPVKSALTRIVYCDGEPAGYLAIHYIQEYHQFSDVERSTLEEITRILSVAVSRYKARTENKELKKIAEMQKQLEEALSMAQSANRAKTTFLNSMSHDIRTPMNAIIGFTGLAVSHIDNKERLQDYLGKIGQSSEHLLSLINDVLDMSRIESGKMNLDEKEENISDIIHTLRDIVQANVHAKQHDFFIDTVNVHDENIICDKLRLNQVLLNILSNSIKYTPAGGTISMRITEKAVKPSGYATFEFCVKDNGMGMDKEFVKTIFEPFTRVKSSTVSGIQGTGLGMAITKNIIDMMGGTIEVESEPGKGTQMTVAFDFKLQSEPKEPEEIPELKGMRALVVDDDINTCMSVAKMARDIGMRSDWCSSGKEAVVRAEEAFRDDDCFKVYIIDWMMPDLNGIETTRRIRKFIGDEVPIIIQTAYDWVEGEEEARAAGVSAFVNKPMFPSDLQRVLSRCLGKAEKSAEPEVPEYDFRGRKLLLVEDNPLNLEIASELLKEYGFVLDTATDGAIALEKLKAAKAGDYELVLMDVQMPVMDGYEATRQIRALGTEVSKIPILAMTANAFEEDRKRAIEAGMDDHIAKPIDINMLKETLAKFL